MITELEKLVENHTTALKSLRMGESDLIEPLVRDALTEAYLKGQAFAAAASYCGKCGAPKGDESQVTPR